MAELGQTSNKGHFTTRKMARIAMLGAIAAFMSFTPFGYIQLGIVKITFMHIPVIIAAIVEGLYGGIIVGLIFGISSLVSNLSGPLAPLFLNPMVSIVPRIMIGIVAYYVYKSTKKVWLTAIAGTLTNTILVLSGFYIFGAALFAGVRKIDPSTVGKVILGIGVTNGIPETIIAVIVITAIVRAIKKFIH
jgi:uncharacterized membrane protein